MSMLVGVILTGTTTGTGAGATPIGIHSGDLGAATGAATTTVIGMAITMVIGMVTTMAIGMAVTTTSVRTSQASEEVAATHLAR